MRSVTLLLCLGLALTIGAASTRSAPPGALSFAPQSSKVAGPSTASVLVDRAGGRFVRVKAMGSPSELKAGLGGDVVSLTLSPADLAKVEGLSQAIKGQAGVRAVSTKQNVLDIRVASPESSLPAILSAVTAQGCRLEFVEYHRPRLDDVFLAYTGRKIKDE